MSDSSLFYYNPELAEGSPRELILAYSALGGVISPTPKNSASLYTTTSLTQPVIDAFLGTSGEFTAAEFNMLGNGLGIIINMQGQAKSVQGFNVVCSDPIAPVPAAAIAVAGSGPYVITVTQTAHGLLTGYVIDVYQTASVGNPAALLGRQVITKLTNDTFTISVSLNPMLTGSPTLGYYVDSPLNGQTPIYVIGTTVPNLLPSAAENSITVGAYGNIGLKATVYNGSVGISNSALSGTLILKALWLPN